MAAQICDGLPQAWVVIQYFTQTVQRLRIALIGGVDNGLKVGSAEVTLRWFVLGVHPCSPVAGSDPLW